MKRVLLAWSSGKDSAWSLEILRRTPGLVVTGLFTAFRQDSGCVAVHGVRRKLVEDQADAVGLPLLAASLPWPCANAEYERIVGSALAGAGVDAVAFGDLFLADIRAYREKMMAAISPEPLFPLWELPTGELALTMIHAGLKARVVCVDPLRLSDDFLGREFDEALLRDLPAGVDPCAENGEFHTFAYDGPMFRRAVAVRAG